MIYWRAAPGGDALEAWQEVLDHGSEGLVAKDPESAYRGRRTLNGSRSSRRSIGRARIQVRRVGGAQDGLLTEGAAM